MYRPAWLLLVMVSLAVAACGDAIRVSEGIAGPGTELIDVYYPATDTQGPIVVMLHGESPSGDGREDLGPLAEATAEQGAVVFVPEWRAVVGPAGREAFRNDPAGHLADQAEDVVCALRFARSRGARLGGDPENLTLVAFSQAGATGAAAAFSDATLDDPGCLPTIDHRPNMFVGLAGEYRWADIVGLLPASVWADHDPFALLDSEHSVHVRLVHGSVDSNVASVESVLLHTALRQAGKAATLTLAEARHADVIDPEHPAGHEAVAQILGNRASVPRVEVRFDGAECSYQGPDALGPGLVDVAFSNEHSADASMVFTPLRGDTWDEFLANTATRPHYTGQGWTQPTFVRIVPAGERLSTIVVPTAVGKWAMSCTTGPNFAAGLVPAAQIMVVEP